MNEKPIQSLEFIVGRLKIKLDLHGIKHEFARNAVILFIENNWTHINDQSMEIITGHSNKMKQIVKEVLDEYKIVYKEGSFDGRNMGIIRTEI